MNKHCLKRRQHLGPRKLCGGGGGQQRSCDSEALGKLCIGLDLAGLGLWVWGSGFSDVWLWGLRVQRGLGTLSLGRRVKTEIHMFKTPPPPRNFRGPRKTTAVPARGGPLEAFPEPWLYIADHDSKGSSNNTNFNNYKNNTDNNRKKKEEGIRTVVVLILVPCRPEACNPNTSTLTDRAVLGEGLGLKELHLQASIT